MTSSSPLDNASVDEPGPDQRKPQQENIDLPDSGQIPSSDEPMALESSAQINNGLGADNATQGDGVGPRTTANGVDADQLTGILPSLYPHASSEQPVVLSAKPLESEMSARPPQSSGFKLKMLSCALAVSLLPVLGVGVATYWTGEVIEQEIAKSQPATALNSRPEVVRRQWSLLLTGTAITAVVAGAIAAWLASRATSSVLRAAWVSNQMVKKIQPGSEPRPHTDTLGQLENNIRMMENHLPALLEKQDEEIVQLKILKHITNKIRTSLNEEDVLSTTVTEARKILRADRVIVYGFNADYYGTVIAESVLPGLPKALWAEIKDPCFAEGYVEKYRAGRVQAINNIHKAGFTQCHLQQLEPFEVKANLVVPILKDQQLFGLLIAHQCSRPRIWQQVEIDFFAQVASQVGFALDHARLVHQVDQANQASVAQSNQATEKFETLRQQIQQLSHDSAGITDLLDLDATTSITSAQDQVQAMAQNTAHIKLILDEINTTHQQADTLTLASQEGIEQSAQYVESLQTFIKKVQATVQPLDQPTQQLAELINLMDHIVKQIQLQAMNAALEAARVGTPGQAFAEIAEKVHGFTRQLDSALTDIQPLITHVQGAAQTASLQMTEGQESLLTPAVLPIDTVREQLQTLGSSHQRLLDLLQQTLDATSNQLETTALAEQLLKQLDETTQAATTRSSTLAQTFQQLINHIQADPQIPG